VTRTALRATRSPAAHVCGLVLVLLVLLPLVGPFGSTSVDEGAVAHQARHLSQGGGWALRPPLPVIPADQLEFPITKSERAEEGWAPYARHPAYALLLALLTGLVGPVGMVLLSVAGTGLAAAAAGRLAQVIGLGQVAPACVWLVGLATPMLFNSYFLIAHSLGAAAVGWAAVFLLGPRQRPAAPLLLVGAAALAAAVLLRTEAVLVGASMAAVLGLGAVTRRGYGYGARCLIVTAGVLGGVALEYLWRRSLLVATGVITGPVGQASQPGWWGNRVEGFQQTILTVGAPNRVLALSVIALLAAAVVLRVGRSWVATRAGLLLVLAAVAGAVLFAVQDRPALVPGLLAAVPGLGAAAILWRPGAWEGARWKPLAATSALSGLAILATQYPEGGSVEWGGRYFAVLLPLVVPLALAVLHHAQSWVPMGRAVLVMLAVQAFAISAGSVRVLAEGSRDADRVLAEITYRGVPATVAGSPGDLRPVIITGDFGPPRLDWRRYEERRWLLLASGPNEVDPQVRALAEAIEPPRLVLLVSRDPARDLRRMGPVRPVGDPTSRGAFTYQVVELLG
jgi:hypothetical protein